METQLLILTLGHVISAVMLYATGIFVLLKNPKSTVNRAFFKLTFFTAFFDTYFAIAVNLDPSPLSYWIWFLNISIVFLLAAYPEFVFAAIGKQKEYRWYTRLTYALGTVVLVIAIINPHLYLDQVIPKLYLKSYLDGGPLYAFWLACYLIVPLFPFGVLVKEYLTGKVKNRLQAEYFIVMSLLGYGIGDMSFPLVFNVPVDPMFGMFVGFYIVPIAYGIVSSNLLDIRVAIKRAFFYALGIAVAAGALTVLILLNNLLIARVPWLQFWTIPVATATVAFVLGRIVWLQSQEADKLKYEFVTVAAHKLRTPLTRIRWEVATLLEEVKDPHVVAGIKNIDDSNTRLIEITDVLLEAARSEESGYWYKNEPLDLEALARSALQRFTSVAKEKNISVSLKGDPRVQKPLGDAQRIASVIEVFVENAIIYTPAGGSISVSIVPVKGATMLSVADNGIGVRPQDREHIFMRFFRSDQAKLADTEGIGLGLSMSKSIIEKHKGKVGVESAGEGKGSTFWFTLPV